MPGYLWLIAAYASFALLVAVTLYRIAVLIRMPFHLRWDLAPLPGSNAQLPVSGNEIHAGKTSLKAPHHSFLDGTVFMLQEVFLLKAVWKNNRRLWISSYCMHMGLYICVLLWSGITGSLFFPLLLDNPITGHLMYGAGFIGYAACAVGACGIILMRVIDDGLRRYSGVSTFFNLALIQFFSVSGLVMWFAESNPVDTVSMFIENCLTANPDMPLYGSTGAHAASLLLFAAVMPFTQMIHFAAKFFTFHRVLWDDRPTGHFHTQNLSALLNEPLQWSAPHAGDGSMRTWRETIDGVRKDEEQ
jgi:nitrate reductase gamma subunit